MATKKAIKDKKLLKVSQMPYMKEFLDRIRRILEAPDMKFKSSSVNAAYQQIITDGGRLDLTTTEGENYRFPIEMGRNSEEIGECCGTSVSFDLDNTLSPIDIRVALLATDIKAKIDEECFLHAFTNTIDDNSYREAAELEGYTIVEWRNSNTGNRIFMATKVVGITEDPDDDGVEVDDYNDGFDEEVELS